MKNLNVIQNVAISGNILYFIWIVWNGIDEGSKGIGIVQAISLTGLLILLVINIFLVYNLSKNKK